jgi:hypothetical protein
MWGREAGCPHPWAEPMSMIVGTPDWLTRICAWFLDTDGCMQTQFAPSRLPGVRRRGGVLLCQGILPPAAFRGPRSSGFVHRGELCNE